MLDSGAFTRLTGEGHLSLEKYAAEVFRWCRSHGLSCAVCQDYLCTPDILQKINMTMEEAQIATVNRYTELKFELAGIEAISWVELESDFLNYACDFEPDEAFEEEIIVDNYYPYDSGENDVHIMPVLHGYAPSDYIKHLELYGDRIKLGMWIGLGSLKAKNPRQIDAIIREISLYNPSLNLHGFGITKRVLKSSIYARKNFFPLIHLPIQVGDTGCLIIRQNKLCGIWRSYTKHPVRNLLWCGNRNKY